MTTIYAKNSLDWVISMGIHIKSDKLGRNSGFSCQELGHSGNHGF